MIRIGRFFAGLIAVCAGLLTYASAFSDLHRSIPETMEYVQEFGIIGPGFTRVSGDIISFGLIPLALGTILLIVGAILCSSKLWDRFRERNHKKFEHRKNISSSEFPAVYAIANLGWWINELCC